MKVKIRKYSRWNIIPEWLKPKRVKVKIDPWDTWSFDHTLAEIILPGLIQLKEKKHGAPCTDNEDVPQYLRSQEIDEHGVDKFHFEKWDYIMDRMIFSFERLADDSREDWYLERQDYKGLQRYEEEVEEGLRLFGKYYRGLWD